MSRKFKFRFWNLDEFIKVDKIAWHDWGITINDSLMCGEECYLQQFTGFKDIDGQEIYEGDNVILEGAPYIYSIVWTDSYGWTIDDNGQLGYDSPQPFNHVVRERARVVGNIFENPKPRRSAELKIES